MLVDGGMAVAVLLLSLGMGAQSDGLVFAYSSTWMVIWNVAAIVPVAWRRRNPDRAATAYVLIILLQLVFGPTLVLTDALALVMVYSVIVYGNPTHTRRFVITAFVMGILTALVIAWTNAAGPAWAVTTNADYAATQQCPTAWKGSLDSGCANVFALDFLWGCIIIEACVVSAVIIAYWQRARMQIARMLSERNDALAAGEEEGRRNAASAERARIARDMHDVVAHTLSIIIVQADGGRYAGTHDPVVARESMENIRRESRRALHDMSILLGVFGGSRDCDYTHVADVIEQARRADSSNVTIGRIVEGTPAVDRLSPAASTAMYRVLQESLTNVRKYAGPGVRVTIREIWDDAGLRVDVIDDGRGTRSSQDGHKPGYGLLGMRERIELVNGTVDAGPRATGGFEVNAFVPYSIPLAEIRSTSTDDIAPNNHQEFGATRVLFPILHPRAAVDTVLRAIGSAKCSFGAHRLPTMDDGSPIPPEERPNTVERLSQWTQRHYWLVDIVVCCLGITLFSFFSPSGYTLMGSGYSAENGLISGNTVDRLMMVAILLPFCIRRRFPETSAALVAAICSIQLIACPDILVFHALALVSLYSANLYGRDGVWRWTSLASAVNAALFAIKVTAASSGFATILDLLILNRDSLSALESVTNIIANLIMSFITVMMVCLATIALAQWSHSSGTNALVLRTRQEALEAEQHEQKILAANIERERIGSSIRSQIRDALTGVSDQADQGIAMLDEARLSGREPDPEIVARSFAAIGGKGRAALTQMRQLLGVLRDTNVTATRESTEKAGSSPHDGLRLSPVAPLDDQLRYGS